MAIEDAARGPVTDYFGAIRLDTPTTDTDTDEGGTGTMPLITDGAIVDEPDPEGLRRSVDRELSERADDEPTDDHDEQATADRISAMRDDDEATFGGYLR